MYNKQIELYEPYQGFVRGNMFPNLFDQYGRIYDVKPMNEQAELLTYIDIFDFALIDIGLYLDIYPDNQKMIELYNNLLQEKKSILRKYEENYGVLTMNSNALNVVPWNWDNNPWPWEA